MWITIREAAGWLMACGAFYLLYLAVGFLKNPETPQIAEASVCVFAGLGLLRIGILLVRMSTAARIVLAARSKTIDEKR